MSRFRFSLQRILDLRANAERLQAILTQRAAAEAGVRRVASEDSAADLTRIQEQTSEIEVAPAGLRHVYELSADAARVRLAADADALREAEAQRLEAEERFTESRQARRALERLREKQAADWSLGTSRAEQERSDEISRQGLRNGGIQ